MTQVSGHEPGHVPPDHRTTAEFGIPKIKADETGDTVVDASRAPDATSVDGPSGRPAPADRVSETVAGGSAAVPGEEPWTMQFGSEAEKGDAVVDASRDPDATSVDGPSGRAASVGGPSETARDDSAAVPGEEPWTMQFGSGADSGGTGERPAGNEMPPTPYTLASAVVETPAAPAGPRPDGSAPGPDDVQTGPQSPPPVESPSPPLGMPATPEPATPNRRRLLVPIVVLAVAAVIAAAGAIVFTLGGGEDKPAAARRSPAASPTAPGGDTATSAPSPPSPGAEEPAPTESPGAAAQPSSQAPGGAAPSTGTADTPPPLSAPPPGPLVRGEGITYQVVQQDPGYFEGEFTVTNRTGAPLTDWRITFEVPGANVKNIWGGRLVRGGSAVEIRNIEGARPIPVGATWEVRFGAEGTPADLRNCRVNGAPCGF
ncbi:hypothetical protein GCM10022416_48260 [Actinomadura keratinilytica]|uniref:CBM2 domain-containing protein n=1 Tax=Actinomadura keratinilytica TaxID=547461 RepID=A0ABP7ZA72_9ACTN